RGDYRYAVHLRRVGIGAEEHAWRARAVACHFRERYMWKTNVEMWNLPAGGQRSVFVLSRFGEIQPAGTTRDGEQGVTRPTPVCQQILTGAAETVSRGDTGDPRDAELT